MDKLQKLGIAFLVACASVVTLQETYVGKARLAEAKAEKEKAELTRRTYKEKAELAEKVYGKAAGPDKVMQREEYDNLLRDLKINSEVPKDPMYISNLEITVATESGPVVITTKQANEYLSESRR